MVNFIKIAVLLSFSLSLHAQPYFDAVTLAGTISPDAGIWRRNNLPVNYQYYLAGVSVPLIFKKDSSKLVISAYTERWEVKAKDIEGIPDAVQSLIFPLTFIKPMSEKWVVAATLIPRWNGNASDLFKNSFQMGGSLIASYKKTNNLTWRLGVYYNSEFFGPFIIPLAGIDWKMGNRDNLFGLLPQILTYEHKVNKMVYWNIVYRMYNNSYRSGYRGLDLSPSFMRITDMQLSISADFYLSKNFVFNIQAGHSLFRKIRLGEDAAKKDYYSNEPFNDNFLVKAGLLYRVRLR